MSKTVSFRNDDFEIRIVGRPEAGLRKSHCPGRLFGDGDDDAGMPGRAVAPVMDQPLAMQDDGFKVAMHAVSAQRAWAGRTIREVAAHSPLPSGSRTKDGEASMPRKAISSWKSPDM